MRHALNILILLGLFSCVDNQCRLTEEKRIKDSIRLTDSLAILKYSPKLNWQIFKYIDEFGESTKKRYITTQNDLFGTFSNSATENSKLKVRILIDNPERISIMLFEYEGNNPVKKSSYQGYSIKVKSKSSNPITIYGINSTDRILLNEKSSRQLTELLKEGGKIQFYIIENSDYSPSSYNFEIENADGFADIITRL